MSCRKLTLIGILVVLCIVGIAYAEDINDSSGASTNAPEVVLISGENGNSPVEVIPGDGQPEGAGPPDSLEQPVLLTGGSEKGPEAKDTPVLPEEPVTPAEEPVLMEAAASPEVTEAFTPPALAPAAAPPEEEVPILVKFKGSAGKADIDKVINECGGKKDREIQKIGVQVLKVPASKAASVVEKYKAHGNVEYASLPVKFKTAGTTDEMYADQWALDKIAWDDALAAGKLPVAGNAIIAVLDTGVDTYHPDLIGRMVPGWSTLTDTVAGADSDPNGHGTALAGIAAAGVNNGIGIAGVAYGPNIQIMPVQVLGADGTGTDLDIIDGIENATDRGASVILMGFSSPDYSPSLDAAIAAAWNEGVVVVAATGNDGSTSATYPAGMAHVLGVTSTDINDQIPSTSNTGSALVAAPGVGIVTTGVGNTYHSISGTSASAAHVAGLAGLLKASEFSNADIFDQIRGAVDPISGGVNPITMQAFGCINVTEAMGDVVVLPTLTPTTVPPTGPVPTYTISKITGFEAFDNVSKTWTSGNVAGYSEGDCVPVKILVEGPETGLEYI